MEEIVDLTDRGPTAIHLCNALDTIRKKMNDIAQSLENNSDSAGENPQTFIAAVVPLCQKNLDFIRKYDSMTEEAKEVDWDDWNLRCFNIIYFCGWLEAEATKLKGNIERFNYLCKALLDKAPEVVNKMKEIAENPEVVRSFTTVQLYYSCLESVKAQIEAERKETLSNINCSLKVLFPK